MPGANPSTPLHRLGLAQWATVWTALAVLSACWLLTAEGSAQGGARWDRSVAINFGSLVLWALLSVPLVRAARRFPLHGRETSRERALRGLSAKALLALACALTHGVLLTGILAATLPFAPRLEGYRLLLSHTLRHNLHFDLLIAALVLFADESFGWYHRYEQRRVEAARLAEQIATERLTAARLRLRPSFVFRALDSIGREIPRDPKRAERMVLQLAALLRALLETGGDDAATARDELDFARSYLEVECGRLGARLSWSLDAAPGALAVELPRLTLQPLLEAAVEATESDAAAARVELRLHGGEGRLRIELEASRDPTSPPLETAPIHGALAAARARLERRYGGAELRSWCEPLAAGRVLAVLELIEPVVAESTQTTPAVAGEEVVWSRS